MALDLDVLEMVSKEAFDIIPETAPEAYMVDVGKDLIKLLAVVRAAQQAEIAFCLVDDGMFKGLVPPEFARVSTALRELEK